MLQLPRLCLKRIAVARAVPYPLSGCTTRILGWTLLTGGDRMRPLTYQPIRRTLNPRDVV